MNKNIIKEIEPHLSEILNSIEDGVSVLDKNGYFVFVNHVIEKRTGISSDKIVGRHYLDLVHPDGREKARDDFERTLSGEKISTYEVVYIDETGREVTVEIHAKPLYKKGSVSGMVAISRNITDRKMTEAALIKREKEYQTLVHNANSAIIRIDTDRRITFLNEFAVRLFGFTNEEIIGKNVIGTIVPGIDSYGRDQAFKMKDIVRHPERYWSTEHQNICKDGRRLWMSWSHKAFFDEHQNIHEILCVGNDVTARKMAEEAKRRSEIRLMTAVESLPFDFYIIDENGCFVMQNSTCRKHWGSLVGKKIEDLDIDKKDKKLWDKIRRKVSQGDAFEDEITFRTGGRSGVYYNVTQPIIEGGMISGVLGINIDITALKETEKALKERESELEINADNLAEINIALEVLLKKKAEDKIEFEDRILHNIKELLNPYVNKMKKTRLNDRQKALLSILEVNVNELISPFSRRLTLKFLKLTPTEVQIANLIKNGKTSQQIALLMGSSRRTIDTHRKNIRKKMSLHGKKGNLRSHLLAYQ
jgi:PAS domain S-box-containing protein